MGIFFKKLFMSLALWLFELIDTIFDVFKSLAGIDRVNANGEEISLMDYFFGQSTLYQVFFGIIICSIAVLAVCMVVAIVKTIINMKGGERKSHAKTVGQGVGSVVISLSIAAIMIAGISASDVMLATLYKTMNVNNTTIAQSVFDACVENTNTLDFWNVQKLRKAYARDGTVMDSMTYLYDYYGFDQMSEYSFYSPPGLISTYDNGLTKFNEPRGSGGVITWGNKNVGEAKALPFEQVWIHVKVSDDKTYWERVVTDGEKPSANVVDNLFSRAYLAADGEYYALNTKALTPVVSSGWMPNNTASSLNFANETADSIYGIYDTYTLLPCFEDEDDPISYGKIRLGSFNYVLAFLCGIIVLIALCSTLLGLVKRIYDLVILFLTLPLITATIPLDDGAKFKLWRETVISKVVLAYGSVFAICVFMLIAGEITTISLMGYGTLANSVFRIFLICGGALTISGGQLLIARIIGASAEESREMAQSARTLMGGAVTGMGMSKAVGRGLFGHRNANGQRVGGLLKGGAGVLGAVGGGLANALGGALGGQAYKSSAVGRGVSKTQQALKGFGGSSGWFGQDKATGGNTLGGAIASGAGKLGGKIAGSGGIVGGIRTAAAAPGKHRREQTREKMQAASAAIKAVDNEITTKAKIPIPTAREVLPGFENTPSLPTQNSTSKKE